MCVRVCVWGGVCVCVCMHVCICVRICICVCVYVWVVVNVCVCVRGHVSANLFWMCIILCAHDFMVCAFVCTCTSNRIRQIDRARVCVCVYVHSCIQSSHISKKFRENRDDHHDSLPNKPAVGTLCSFTTVKLQTLIGGCIKCWWPPWINTGFGVGV